MNANVYARKLRIHIMKLARQSERDISKVFLDFENSFVSDNKQYFDNKIKVDYSKFVEAMKKSVKGLYENTIKKTVTYVNDLFQYGLSKKDIDTIAKKEIVKYNKEYLGSKIKNITDTTRNSINKIISNNPNKSPEEIARLIKARIHEMSIGRARTIARTETSNSMNSSYRQAAIKVKKNKKKWVHNAIGEPRENHVALNGKELLIDEMFDLGGEKCLYPHDPNLSASETVNCHCTCIYF